VDDEEVAQMIKRYSAELQPNIEERGQSWVSFGSTQPRPSLFLPSIPP
jgi:hypothetical protein